MLSDFTWNMTGYIPKHQVNPHGDGIIPYVAERIFQLEPEPPKVGSLNEYILSALQEKNLIHLPVISPFDVRWRGNCCRSSVLLLESKSRKPAENQSCIPGVVRHAV